MPEFTFPFHVNVRGWGNSVGVDVTEGGVNRVTPEGSDVRAHTYEVTFSCRDRIV